MSTFDKHEFELEKQLSYELRRAKIVNQAKSKVWTTRDNQQIPITKLSDNHLLNIYKMLEQENVFDIYMPWLIVLQEEIVARGLDYPFVDRFF